MMPTVTTLTGANSFLLQQRLRSLIDVFESQHGDMGLEQLDGEEVTYDRMREALESLPFLVSHKLVVLRQPGANKQFTEQAEKLLGALPDETSVIIVEPKLDKRSSYYKYLQKQTNYQDFSEPDEHSLARWLVGQATTLGGSLSPSDARYMVELVGANQRLLASELIKLINYVPAITRAAIDLLVEVTPQSSIFDLIDAAFAGNLKRAMTLYDEQRQSGVEPQQMIAMIAWQLHIVALVKAAGERDSETIAREAKLSPYVVRKSTGIAKRLSLTDVKALVHEVVLLDAKLKSQPIDADEALRNLIIRLGNL